MNYEIEFSSQAKRFIKNLDKKDSLRLLDKFNILKENPFRYLEHYEGSGYKFRVGDIRSLIDVDFTRRILFVRVIDKRGRIYKR